MWGCFIHLSADGRRRLKPSLGRAQPCAVAPRRRLSLPRRVSGGILRQNPFVEESAVLFDLKRVSRWLRGADLFQGLLLSGEAAEPFHPHVGFRSMKRRVSILTMSLNFLRCPVKPVLRGTETPAATAVFG